MPKNNGKTEELPGFSWYGQVPFYQLLKINDFRTILKFYKLVHEYKCYMYIKIDLKMSF